MSGLFTNFYNTLFNCIAPAWCSYCQQRMQERIPLCERCHSLLEPVVSHRLVVSAKLSVVVHARAHYAGPMQAMIRAKNYDNHIASRQLGYLLAEQYKELVLASDYLVPVPLHWTRYAYRGFNQAELIAQVLGVACNRPVVTLLRRTRRTKFQAWLSKEERQHNVNEVFSLCNRDEQFYHKKILIIDDLMTTGSTILAASKVLVSLRPQSITALVAARAR